jgi:pimeloyl-ACP methyl ester carboxylesterase
VNIEGNLTASDAFFSGRTVQADRRGGFERFFRRFVATTRSGPWAQANPATAHYGAELERCEPRAFLAAAHELVNWTTPLDAGWSPMQRLYAGLQLPRIYLHGTRDQGRETLEWLDEANLERAPLEGAGHWVMNEEPDLVATLLATLANAWI